MTARIFVNLTRTYVPLYLQATLQLSSSYVATIPLIMFLVGFITSTVMKDLNRQMGLKTTFLLGCTLGKDQFWTEGDNVLFCKMWLIRTRFCKLPLDTLWLQKWHYVCSIRSIWSCSTYWCRRISYAYNKAWYDVVYHMALVLMSLQFHSLSITAELIGQNCESAAFIYGAMSITYKLAEGLVVLAVQSLVPSFPEECNNCDGCSPFYSQVLFFVCGGAALLGILSMLSLVPFTVGQRFSKKESNYFSLN